MKGCVDVAALEEEGVCAILGVVEIVDHRDAELIRIFQGHIVNLDISPPLRDKTQAVDKNTARHRSAAFHNEAHRLHLLQCRQVIRESCRTPVDIDSLHPPYAAGHFSNRNVERMRRRIFENRPGKGNTVFTGIQHAVAVDILCIKHAVAHGVLVELRAGADPRRIITVEAVSPVLEYPRRWIEIEDAVTIRPVSNPAVRVLVYLPQVDIDIDVAERLSTRYHISTYCNPENPPLRRKLPRGNRNIRPAPLNSNEHQRALAFN